MQLTFGLALLFTSQMNRRLESAVFLGLALSTIAN